MDDRVLAIIGELSRVEEELRDLAFGALQTAIADGDDSSRMEQQVLKARRSVEKAVHDLEKLNGN